MMNQVFMPVVSIRTLFLREMHCRTLLSSWDEQHPGPKTAFTWSPRNIVAIAAACVVSVMFLHCSLNALFRLQSSACFSIRWLSCTNVHSLPQANGTCTPFAAVRIVGELSWRGRRTLLRSFAECGGWIQPARVYRPLAYHCCNQRHR